MVRLYRERTVVTGQRFIDAPQLFEHTATVVEGFGVIRLYRERTVVAGQRLIETLQVCERIATIIEGFGEVRLYRERTIMAGQRFVETVEASFWGLSSIARSNSSIAANEFFLWVSITSRRSRTSAFLGSWLRILR